MTRIAVGGFLHETNTFAPTKATYDDFVHGGGWPAMAHGADVLKVMRKHQCRPCRLRRGGRSQWLGTGPDDLRRPPVPSAHVTKDAFERIVKEMVDGIAAAGPLDAVYLDLHGAMVTEHLDDGEGEMLARVRKVIGKDLPLVVSLDLHANVTPEMMEHADALIAYRTYPARRHGRHRPRLRKTSRADAEDEAALCKGVPAIAVPDPDQLAMHQRPADQGHLRKARGAGERRGADAVLCAGLSGRRFQGLRAERVRLWQDAGRCRCRGRQDGRAGRKPRGRFRRPDLFARRRRAPRDGAGEVARRKPIIIADTQDNPGAGGDSDTTGMLRALVRNKATAPPPA